MRKIVLGLFTGICLFIIGCGNTEIKQPLYNPNIFSSLLNKDKLTELPQKLDTEVMRPAMQLAKEYEAEYKHIAGNNKEQQELYAKDAAAAEKYLNKVRELQKAMSEPRDAIIPHYRQALYAKQYLDNFANLLESKTKLPQAAKKNVFISKINGCTFNMKNAELGYEHEFKLLTTGQDTYRFDLPTFRKLRKGMDYWSIVKIFNMPGIHIKSSNVIISGKPVHQDDWLWQYNNAFVLVTLQNGKAVGIKQNGLW